MPKREKRIYVVRSINEDGSPGEMLGLVSAWERRLAVNHLAQTTLTAAKATQQEMYEAGQQGMVLQSTDE